MGLSLELVRYHLFQFLNRIRAGIDVDIIKKMTCAEKMLGKVNFLLHLHTIWGIPMGGGSTSSLGTRCRYLGLFISKFLLVTDK